MTKALRITSVVVAVAAVLLVATPVIFSPGMDEQTKSWLDSPSVLESVNKAASVEAAGTISPLVQQAKSFAAYLNPPPPPRPHPSPSQSSQPAIRPQSPVSSKFSLIATSYYPLRPDMSLALIDEPGEGLRWVRQSSKIGYLIVEEIKDGAVVIRDGARTYEIEPKRTPRRSLIKGESTAVLEADTAAPEPADSTTTAQPRRSSPRVNARRNHTRPIPATAVPSAVETPEIDPHEQALLDEFMKHSQDIEDPNEWLQKAAELMDRLAHDASNVTDEEAALLDELGKELQDANEEAPAD